MMRVAAVLTTKDRRTYLERALASIRHQTRPVDEIVVVDDGSAPGTNDGLGADVRLLRNERSTGAAHARNQGVAATTAEIVMFLDDDDAWAPDKVAEQCACFDADAEVVLVYSGRALERDDAPGVVTRRAASRLSGRLFEEMLRSNLVGVPSAVAVLRAAFDEAGGFDEGAPRREDYDLWLRITPLGKVAWDGGYRVHYTVFANPKKQRSAQLDGHVDGARYLIAKYGAEIEALPMRHARRARAEKWFTAARRVRRSSWSRAFVLVVRSFLQWPRPAALALLLPQFVLTRLGY